MREESPEIRRRNFRWLPARRKPARQERVGRRLCRRLGLCRRSGFAGASGAVCASSAPRLCRVSTPLPAPWHARPLLFWRAGYPRRAPVPPELPVSPARPYSSGDLSLPGAERADGTPAPPGAPLRLRSPRRSRRAGSAGSLGRARHHRHSRRAGRSPASPEPTARREPGAGGSRPRRAARRRIAHRWTPSVRSPHRIRGRFSSILLLLQVEAHDRLLTLSFLFLPERAGPFRRQGIVEATLRTRSCRQGRS